NSKIIILGSFPSVKSREEGFFYGHPQNRFWRVLAALLGEDIPSSVAEKKELLLRNGIALWDVVASCDISGSSDSSIKDVVPNDLSFILENSNIKKIYLNGGTALRLYDKYLYKKTGVPGEKLPSTSPANASWNFARLVEAWKVIKNDI
ncbi:MAG: DNA-deoxyinosine glycosylase, partial [Eubacteriales bacterium]